MQKIKKPLSIILAVLMVMSVFIAVPMSASALEIDDVQSLLSSMEAKINDYYAQGDWDHARELTDYYDGLDGALEYADGQVNAEVESAYNAAYEYFMAISGAGVSYPDVNNVYRATNGWVNVTVSDLQPGDVLVTSDTLSVRKGDCTIVLVGGTYCDEGNLSRTYPNNVTLGNNISFLFGGNYARIIDADNAKNYDPVYNNALGNAYMVIGKENGTVYLAGYYFTIYTVTWKNGDDVIKTDTVEEGATPTYDGETPTKAEDENYTYTFSGWKNGTNTYGKDETLPAVTADVTYTAQFDAYPKSGSFDGLNWSIDDEDTLTLSGSGAIPEDAFKSNPVIKKVIINSSVTGVGANAFADCANLAELTFDSETPISFANGEYTYLTDTVTVNVPAGSTYQYTVQVSTIATEKTAYKDVLPTLQAEFKEEVAWGTNYEEALSIVLDNYADWVLQQTGEYPVADDFEFVLEDEERTGNIADGQKYASVFGGANVHVMVPTYTVTWKNGDTVLKTEALAEGTTPTYNGTTPTKAADDTYTYTFAGWSPAIAPVTEDVTYTATFTETEKPISSDDLYAEMVIDAGKTIEFTALQNGNTWRLFRLEVYLDDVLEKQVEVEAGSTTEPDRYYTTTKKCIVYMYGSGFGEHYLYLKSAYTVTWKDEDGTVLKTEDVAKGDTPSYGATPTKAEDENYTYTFAGWTPEITAVTGDITYTATYTATAKPKDLFPQHSITLGGNIGVNFYIDSAAADFAHAGSAVVKFTWDNGNYHEEVNLKELTPDGDGYYKATVDVVAAQMAHKIHAEVYLNGEKLEQTDDYSVQDYAETVFANPEKYDSEKHEQLRALAQALLNYGAMAQTVFDSSLKEHPALANTTVGDNGYAAVTAEQIGAAINGDASDLNAIATQLGAKYYTNSLIYLSKNTLRIYFTPTSYPGTIPNADKYAGNLSGYYYYVDHANIPAAELDDQQTFTVGGTTFTFSALDYAKAVVESTKMEPEQQNLAKSLYLYNVTANAYFDAAPAPAENEVISSGFIDDFSTLNVGDYIAKGVEYAADDDYKVVLTGGTYGTESRDGIVVRNGDYSFNAGEYGMGTYSYHVPQPNVFIEDYNENEKFYPAVDGVEGNAFVVVAKDDTQKIITIAGANVIQN